MASALWAFCASRSRFSIVGISTSSTACNLESSAEGGRRARSLRGQTDRLSIHLICGFGALVEAAVLIAYEHINGTIRPLIGAYHRLLEEGLDELDLGVVRVGADDDGLLNLLHGVGRQGDSED